MDIRAALARIVEGDDLSTAEMAAVMRQVMTGEASDAQIGALLVGMRMKGETVDEITGAVQVMRELATGVPLTYTHVLDPATGRYHESEIFTGSVKVSAPFSVEIDLGQI